jgi:hypothetical protein
LVSDRVPDLAAVLEELVKRPEAVLPGCVRVSVGMDLVVVDPAAVDSLILGVSSVTGHTVVEIAIVEVTTLVESAGQLVTVAAQLVTVTSLVV